MGGQSGFRSRAAPPSHRIANDRASSLRSGRAGPSRSVLARPALYMTTRLAGLRAVEGPAEQFARVQTESRHGSTSRAARAHAHGASRTSAPITRSSFATSSASRSPRTRAPSDTAPDDSLRVSIRRVAPGVLGSEATEHRRLRRRLQPRHRRARGHPERSSEPFPPPPLPLCAAQRRFASWVLFQGGVPAPRSSLRDCSPRYSRRSVP